ncbi:MAG TPA: sugar transferase [Halococcus sp.]|nr:sugar transferase [Halococcus sp.]
MKLSTGWSYRIVSSLGAVVIVVLSILVANHPFVQSALMALPVLSRLESTVLTGGNLVFAVLTALPVIFVSSMVLFKPRPRRILDTISLTLRCVLGASLALAAIGYYDYTYRLPRTTLLLMTLLLCVFLPAWFVLIRRQPASTERTVLVGDDPEAMAEILETYDLPIIGYVAPALEYAERPRRETGLRFADGGVYVRGRLDEIERLGGPARLDDVLTEYDIDTAILAFERSDRAEFFGALATCYNHGVVVKVHRKHADSVLAIDTGVDGLIDTELEPWDPQDRAIKRLFDIGFAAAGLLVLIPVICVIAVAIKLDDGGPLLYNQERTAEFGETFRIYKFRSMVPNSENSIPLDDRENKRITRVGRFLRRTHLDEIPQLGAILIGHMSVVGPRAVWVDEEKHLEAEISTWRKRWFVKPGLTGLAQIHDISSTRPHEKFRYDLMYIQEQSFWFDLQIVVRQVWLVLTDLLGTIGSR